ncbi:MAG: fungal-specific transcription factor domain-containing protein [Benjaminiella poitrasii]|nr:MAG: fungal-specific transcription factor domain-containing protein [Benjaminiella poitrasii]
MFATLELPIRDDSRHKRLKVGRACHPCRMKKIKCDGKQPCMQCKARRRKCIYLKNPDETYIRLDPIESSTSSTISESYLQDIGDNLQLKQQQQRQAPNNQTNTIVEANNNNNNKLDRLFNSDNSSVLSMPTNQMIANTNTTTTTTNTNINTTTSITTMNSSIQPSVTRPDKMIEQLTSGLVRLTLHQDTTSTSNQLVNDTITPWRSYGEFVRWTSEPALPTTYNASIEMPSRPTQEYLINVFFDECHQHTLPTLSRSMFYDQLKTKGPLITPLLLNVIYAHASKHVSHLTVFRSDPDNPATQGDLFYDRARRLLDDFLDEPRLSTVIALIYMALYDCDRPSARSRCWMYTGMATRMCFELGLHTANYSSQLSQCDIELRKRVMWTCFVMDKLESCTMERPQMVTTKDIALDFASPLPEDGPTERLTLEGFNQLCRLTILLEKILAFFAYERRQWTTVPEEHQLMQFLESLYQWRERLPVDLQWSPGLTPLSAVVANLHLVAYDLELSLVMCFKNEEVQRDRRTALANTITQLVSLTVQQPRLMYTFALSTFSGIFAALTHAVDFESPRLDIAESARAQFRKSLEDVRLMVERIPTMHDLRHFTKLVDLALQQQQHQQAYASAFSAIHNLCHNGGSSGAVSHEFQMPTAATTTTQAGVDLFVGPSVTKEATNDTSFTTTASMINSTILDCYPSTATNSPTGSAAAVAAAAAAVGAVGTPSAAGPHKSIEPADYTFELISVADEWARSLIY